ncbi:borealin-like isoform X2 [Liolophura sinensis]
MPRRRATKILRRAQPKLPEGDEGKDLSEKERKEKLRVFLADFDLELIEKIRLLEEEKRQLLVDIDVQCHALISQIPSAVRKMSMEDFISCGGTVEAALRWLRQGGDNSGITSSSSGYSVKLSGRAGQRLDSILEDTPAVSNLSIASSKSSTVKKPGRAKRGKGRAGEGSTSMLPPSTSSVRTSRFRTPARGPTSTVWDTPLITPKFDPKLPTTPEGERKPRPGERLVSMDGSPVCFDKDQSSVITLAVGKRTLVLPDIPDDLSLDQLSIPDGEGDTSEKIQRLHALLTNYLKRS